MKKRLFDIFASGIGLLVVGLVFVVVSVQVYRKIGMPIFFKQIRVGKNGKLFEITKFRTMRQINDDHGNPLSDSKRLIPFGIFLRSSSLDELPSLWNVLKGDMSIVGPRPLLVDYLALYTDEQNRRHKVKPGVTGWAQINGRNAISWEQKFEHDVWYVDNQSFWLDIKIIIITIIKVLRREGVSASDHSTMPPFQGSKSLNK